MHTHPSITMTVTFDRWSVHAVRRWAATVNERMTVPGEATLAIAEMKRVGTMVKVKFAPRAG